MNYLIVDLEIPNIVYREIIMTELSYINYESFEELENGLQAYILEESYEKNALQSLIDTYKNQTEIKWLSTKPLPNQNWNALWESNFKYVAIDDKLLIKAPFHEVDGDFEHTIVIEPKMAFGTGHHATTFMVSQQMLTMNFSETKVLDFGCGTGILAMLAEMLGSKQIVAIDYDPLSYENTLENAEKNNIHHIEARLGTHEAIGDDTFDIILANINRNVILHTFGKLCNALHQNGYILFSGILETDMELIKKEAEKHHLHFINSLHKDNWVMLAFRNS
ncbi:MAG: 50S ribosomal protein L11 methyltransferase [Chitinophagales bacterium]